MLVLKRVHLVGLQMGFPNTILFTKILMSSILEKMEKWKFLIKGVRLKIVVNKEKHRKMNVFNPNSPIFYIEIIFEFYCSLFLN